MNSYDLRFQRQEDCDICLQPKTLTQAIEGMTLPLVCHSCRKTINLVRGWFRRHGIEIQNHSTGEMPVERNQNGNFPVETQKTTQ